MTMTVTMTQTRMGESGSLLVAGSSYSVSDAFGAFLVGAGLATDPYAVLTPPQRITEQETPPIKSLVSKDGISGNWRNLPASGLLMRLRMTGTGTVTMDSATGELGAGTVTTAVYTTAVAGTQIDDFAYPGDAARSIRLTLTGTAAVEVY